jgi:D-sedoheptulose 7-phosphate isomerase
MLEQGIQQHFFDSADLQYQVADVLARPIAAASSAMLGCITAGGKVLAAGLGPSMADAQRFVAAMVGAFERERPGLAALSLSADSVLMASLGRDAVNPAPNTSYLAAQIHVLGMPGDVLLLVTTHASAEALDMAIVAAHEKEMTVVMLCGNEHENWSEALQEADVLISVPHERAARVWEVHTLALNCLLYAVDIQLLGEQESA